MWQQCKIKITFGYPDKQVVTGCHFSFHLPQAHRGIVFLVEVEGS